MINNVYLKIKSKRHGDLKGSVIQRGKEGLIALISVNHQLLSQRDASTGQAAGKRQHKPIIFTKEPDKLTPLFYQMLVENIEVEEASFLFYGTETTSGIGYAAGAERLLYTINLKKAFVANVDLTLYNAAEDLHKPGCIENISIVYNEIEWEWKDGKIVAQDQWRNPV